MIPVYIKSTAKVEKERGRSEKEIKKKLEKDGWIVWRSSLLPIIFKEDLFPNVRKKYASLHALLDKHHSNSTEELLYLCAVHHGLPDFICFRNGFKFVECKRGYEPLRKGQKKCIARLQEMGFLVEVHILADYATKTTKAVLEDSGKKRILEKQVSIKKFKK